MMEQSLLWWNRTWLMEYKSSMWKIAWHSCSIVMRYVMIGLFIWYSWCLYCQSVLWPSHNTKKGIVPLIWIIHALSIAFLVRKVKLYISNINFQIAMFLLKARDVRKFSILVAQEISHYTHETLQKQDTIFHGFSEFYQGRKINTWFPQLWIFSAFCGFKILYGL